MGNCIVIQREKTWMDEEDEEWQFSERQGLLKDEEKRTEVTIRIPKKQLEKLLGREKLPVEKVLEEIVNNGVVNLNHDHYHWKPRLQSIPELSDEI